MKICHIAPPETNSATSRGGPTRVFFGLNEALAQITTDLYVYGHRDSRVHGHLTYYYDTNLNKSKFYLDEPRETTKECYGIQHYAKAYEYAKGFDIIQSHLDRTLFFARLYPRPISVNTLHGEIRYYHELLIKNFNSPNVHFVLPSHSQAAKVAKVCNNYSVIHNGINLTEMKLQTTKGDYFLFVGRLVAHKGAHLAIAACLAVNQKLVLIGKPDPSDPASSKYFEREIVPYLKNPLIKYRPEAPHDQMASYYQSARAAVLPLLDYTKEPFGLTFVESLACGTPVICFDNPLTRELFGQAPVAYLAKDFADLKTGLAKTGKFLPADCRRHAENNFSREQMAREYYRLYEKLLTKSKQK